MSDIDKLKGSFSVYHNGEYVVLTGSKLLILKPDGSLVACRKDLRYPKKITFLPGNRMLLCSIKAVFHMIDLHDGSDLWTTTYEKSNLNIYPFAISPDEAYAYTYDTYRGRNFITRLFLNTPEHEVDTQDMYMDIGATYGILCDENGIPCLLKALTETIGGKTVHQNGIRIHDYDGIDPGGTTTWKSKWSFPDRSAISFWGSTNRVLTNDLHFYEPESDTLTPILEPEVRSQLPQQTIIDRWPDLSRRYMFLLYQTGTVIIDLHTRSIAAQYAATAHGCLIGSEYWVCVNDRICRKPFPAHEGLPQMQKTSYSMDWYFASRPELW